jgi:hypothetical protein
VSLFVLIVVKYPHLKQNTGRISSATTLSFDEVKEQKSILY